MAGRSKMKGIKIRNAIYGYMFILPFVIGFLFFMIKPLAQSFYMSLSVVDVSSSGFAYNFAGLKNYIYTFTIDAEFNQMITSEIGNMVYNALATMVFSFFVALLLNQDFKGRTFVRAIFFLPVILSSGVLVGLEYNNSLLSSMKDMTTTTDGTSVTTVIENILENSGIGGRVFDTVFEIVNSVYKVAIASGIQIIIFLSGLQTIPKSMYEAASIEGCSAWESLWKITFPMVSPMILVNWIYTIIDFFMNSDSDVMNKIDVEMSQKLDYGFSTAMAWIYFLVVLAIIGLSSWIISKVVYYYE